MTVNKDNYRSKKKRSSINIIRAGAVRLAASSVKKICNTPAVLSGILQKGLHKYRAMPRIFRILAVYAITVIVVFGIYYWRLSGLRVDELPQTEPPFDWSIYQPYDLLDPVAGPAGEPEQKGVDPEQDSEKPEVLAPLEEIAEPVFRRGKWPVRGDIFYGFHEAVVQRGSGYPLYFTSKGVAIKAAAGTEAVAAWDGKVIKVMDLDKPHGKSVTIRHDHGLISYYGALQKSLVKVGDMVVKGQTIGLVGSGFDSEPDHLYLEILKDGRVVNPVDYLLQ